MEEENETTGLREGNSLCSTVAMSWSLPLGEQIRTRGNKAKEERTEGCNREVSGKHRAAAGSGEGSVSQVLLEEGAHCTLGGLFSRLKKRFRIKTCVLEMRRHKHIYKHRG